MAGNRKCEQLKLITRFTVGGTNSSLVDATVESLVDMLAFCVIEELSVPDWTDSKMMDMWTRPFFFFFFLVIKTGADS